ncbi:MAG: polymer-forming cytoskeletal protein [Thioalkalispiraceae bacterium]|jgi:cytoskeletal protein CcmA (bactofilin family)
MIDMKQIKENVSNKIKTYHTEEEAEIPQTETRTTARNTVSKESSAAIGASIRIRGDVSGDENLIIQGEVDGTIVVQGHNVTISKTGKVKANIEAKQIIVEGKLEGDLSGDEKVIIRETGNVYGNIVAPRVKLEDGAMFKGSIEMEPHTKGQTNTSTPMKNLSQASEATDRKLA